MPQIRFLSLITADLTKYDRVRHSLGGTRGRYSWHQQTAFARKNIHYLQYLIRGENVLLDPPIKT